MEENIKSSMPIGTPWPKAYYQRIEKNIILKKRHFEKNTQELAIFKSLPQPFGSMYFIETRHIYSVVILCSLE